jgi:hypothetical protein
VVACAVAWVSHRTVDALYRDSSLTPPSSTPALNGSLDDGLESLLLVTVEVGCWSQRGGLFLALIRHGWLMRSSPSSSFS